jgi:chromosome segregation ATPase
MTDDELKALVASLAVSQKETDAQMQKTHEELQKTHAELRKTDEQMRKTHEELQKTHAELRKTDEQMRKTDAKLERMGVYLGNVTQNQGDVAEEFFFNSLAQDTRLGGLYFDDITKNMKRHRGNLQEEYDLFMTNGDSIAVIEVKYKAHVNDLDKLDRKIKNFKLLFPFYQHHKLYGALAGFYVNDDTKKETLNRGYFVLQRCGDLIHTECNDAQLKVVL